MDKTVKNEKSSLEKSLVEAKKEMSSCILDSSWTFTIPAVIISIPFCIRFKTYAPLVVSGIVSSGIDYHTGMTKCEQFSKNIKEIKLRIAILEHGPPPS